MAKATNVIHKQKIDPEVKHEQEIKNLEKQLLEHKDSLEDLLSILEKMKEHELLDMLNAGLGQSEDIVHRLVMAVHETDVSQSLKNMLLVIQLLGMIDMEELEPLVLKFNKGVEIAGKYEHGKGYGGYLSLLKTLKDPQLTEGLNIIVRIIKGLGVDVSEEKKSTSQLEKNEERHKREQQNNTKKPLSTKWFVLSGALIGGVVPLLFRKN
ncbi:hypothetical protein ABDK10_00445 [Staphylococcus aureus]